MKRVLLIPVLYLCIESAASYPDDIFELLRSREEYAPNAPKREILIEEIQPRHHNFKNSFSRLGDKNWFRNYGESKRSDLNLLALENALRYGQNRDVDKEIKIKVPRREIIDIDIKERSPSKVTANKIRPEYSRDWRVLDLLRKRNLNTDALQNRGTQYDEENERIEVVLPKLAHYQQRHPLRYAQKFQNRNSIELENAFELLRRRNLESRVESPNNILEVDIVERRPTKSSKVSRDPLQEIDLRNLVDQLEDVTDSLNDSPVKLTEIITKKRTKNQFPRLTSRLRLNNDRLRVSDIINPSGDHHSLQGELSFLNTLLKDPLVALAESVAEHRSRFPSSSNDNLDIEDARIEVVKILDKINTKNQVPRLSSRLHQNNDRLKVSDIDFLRSADYHSLRGELSFLNTILRDPLVALAESVAEQRSRLPPIRLSSSNNNLSNEEAKIEVAKILDNTKADVKADNRPSFSIVELIELVDKHRNKRLGSSLSDFNNDDATRKVSEILSAPKPISSVYVKERKAPRKVTVSERELRKPYDIDVVSFEEPDESHKIVVAKNFELKDKVTKLEFPISEHKSSVLGKADISKVTSIDKALVSDYLDTSGSKAKVESVIATAKAKASKAANYNSQNPHSTKTSSSSSDKLVLPITELLSESIQAAVAGTLASILNLSKSNLKDLTQAYQKPSIIVSKPSKSTYDDEIEVIAPVFTHTLPSSVRITSAKSSNFQHPLKNHLKNPITHKNPNVKSMRSHEPYVIYNSPKNKQKSSHNGHGEDVYGEDTQTERLDVLTNRNRKNLKDDKILSEIDEYKLLSAQTNLNAKSSSTSVASSTVQSTASSSTLAEAKKNKSSSTSSSSATSESEGATRSLNQRKHHRKLTKLEIDTALASLALAQSLANSDDDDNFETDTNSATAASSSVSAAASSTAADSDSNSSSSLASATSSSSAATNSKSKSRSTGTPSSSEFSTEKKLHELYKPHSHNRKLSKLEMDTALASLALAQAEADAVVHSQSNAFESADLHQQHKGKGKTLSLLNLPQKHKVKFSKSDGTGSDSGHSNGGGSSSTSASTTSASESTNQESTATGTAVATGDSKSGTVSATTTTKSSAQSNVSSASSNSASVASRSATSSSESDVTKSSSTAISSTSTDNSASQTKSEADSSSNASESSSSSSSTSNSESTSNDGLLAPMITIIDTDNKNGDDVVFLVKTKEKEEDKQH